jgi:nucleotide-binding universal stress UspA family protein
MAAGTGRIVAGVDGSDSSKAALRWAIQQAKLTGASVDAVMAWSYSTAYAPMTGSDVDIEGGTRKALTEIIKDVAGSQPEVPVRQLVGEGHAAEVLLREARDADLLVVGSRGRGGFASAIVGSVSLQCVLHAHCPVLVLRDGHEGRDQG